MSALKRALDRAIAAKLLGSIAVTSFVGTYGAPPSPAVFLKSPVPAGVEPPYVAVRGIHGQRPFDTKEREGREVTRDILMLGLDQGVTTAVDDVAEAVRALFHKQDLVVAGWDTLVGDVQGPIAAEADDGFLGQIVTVRWILRVS